MDKETFNQFCRNASVNWEREEFYNFVRKQLGTPEGAMVGSMTGREWFKLWNQFLGQDDAQDLADTQADALGVLF